jgi:hypothetical protein
MFTEEQMQEAQNAMGIIQRGKNFEARCAAYFAEKSRREFENQFVDFIDQEEKLVNFTAQASVMVGAGVEYRGSFPGHFSIRPTGYGVILSVKHVAQYGDAIMQEFDILVEKWSGAPFVGIGHRTHTVRHGFVHIDADFSIQAK